MGLTAKAGSVALDTSTGSQVITGVGFLPKVLFAVVTENTADGIIAESNLSVGVATGSTNEWCLHQNTEDSVTAVDSGRELQDDACIIMYDSGSGTTHRVRADFTSFDASDGFTINISDATGGGAYRLNYLCLGGTDLTNLTTGKFTVSGSTGDQIVTGLGFQPDFVMFASANDAFADTPRSNITNGWGFASGASNEAVVSLSSNNSSDPSENYKYQENDACIAYINESGGAIEAEAILKQFTADGFDITWNDAAPANDEIAYLAIKGGQWHVGDLLTQTSTGPWTETGVGFTPVGGMFASFQNAASASAISDFAISVGAADSSTSRWMAGGVAENNVGDTNTDQYADDALVYASYDNAQTLTGSADFDNWNSDGFVLDMVDADPTQFEMVYFVVGAEDAGSTIIVTPGTLTLTGVTATITPGSVTITATPGALTLTGVSATITPGSVTITATPGALTLSGVAATIVPGAITVAVTPGALTLAGIAATITPGAVTITATPGVLTLAGVAATITPGAVTIVPTPGALTLSGIAATVTPGAVSITATPGTLTLAGIAATITPGAVTVTATPGTLTLTGATASVSIGNTIVVTPGTLTLTGVSATITPGSVSIVVSVATLLLTGISASVSTQGGPIPDWTVIDAALHTWTVIDAAEHTWTVVDAEQHSWSVTDATKT